MFHQMVAILLIAILFVIALRSIGRGHIGNWILQLIEKYCNLDWYEALKIYGIYVRNNIDMIIMVTIILFFIILFRFSLLWFTKYFDEIIFGVNKLAEENKERIVLSPELNFVEKKLNQVKDKLEKKTRESLESEQRKNDLVVYLAHDIKTPLTSVIGYMNLLDEVPDITADQRAKYIHIALKKAYHLEKLIDEFFDITRYNLQNIKVEKAKIDLYYMLVQMADEFYPVLTPEGKKIIINANEDIIIFGDPDKLARVFNNILKNAAAYSNDNSTIEISAKVQLVDVVIQFKNIGKTIPKDQLTSIFEKFYRIDDSRSTATGGAGLGLAIAKEIVVLHGGTIKVESDNSITKFTVTLPL
nr:HAMP domain-containing sensor histidine kinase [Sedimentibacter sp.]